MVDGRMNLEPRLNLDFSVAIFRITVNLLRQGADKHVGADLLRFYFLEMVIWRKKGGIYAR
jgi:hypothetical protein